MRGCVRPRNGLCDSWAGARVGGERAGPPEASPRPARVCRASSARVGRGCFFLFMVFPSIESKLRHFVCIFQVEEIKKLNKNMYNENTIFYEIDNDMDVDYENDLKEFIKSNTIKE